MKKADRTRVAAKLRLVADRIERGDAELSPALARALDADEPALPQNVTDELDWRFVNDTGAGTPAAEVLRRIRETFGKRRRKATA